MTDQETSFPLAEGIEVFGFDLEGVNRFLKTDRTNLPGIAVIVSGTPGDENVMIVSGEPVGETIVKSANMSLRRAAIISMSTYYDMRHVEFLAAALMSGIAASRDLTPKDEEAANRIKADPSALPHGDVPRMVAAGQGLQDILNKALQREIYKGRPL